MGASEWRGSPVYKHPCQCERRESWRVFHRGQVVQVIAEFYGEHAEEMTRRFCVLFGEDDNSHIARERSNGRCS